MQTQALVARYLAENGWPFATDAGAGRSGTDVLNTPGLTWEVKARRDFTPEAWLRQAVAGDAVPLVVWRPNGAGPAGIENWAMMLRFGHGVHLLRDAGYGDPRH